MGPLPFALIAHGNGVFHRGRAMGSAVPRNTIPRIVSPAIILLLAFTTRPMPVAYTGHDEDVLSVRHTLRVYLGAPGKSTLRFLMFLPARVTFSRSPVCLAREPRRAMYQSYQSYQRCCHVCTCPTRRGVYWR